MKVLYLLHPTVVTNETLVIETKKKFENEEVKQLLISQIKQIEGKFNLIYYLNPNNGENEKYIPNEVIEIFFKLLEEGGKVDGNLPNDQNLDILMNGFIIEQDKIWVKPKKFEVISLKKPKANNDGKSINDKLSKLGSFKKLNNVNNNLNNLNKVSEGSSPIGLTDSDTNDELEQEEEERNKRKLEKTKLTYFSDDENGDEDFDDEDSEIDEEELLNSNNYNYKLIKPKKCDSSGKKRRKACKDCTCGLKEIEEKEIENQKLLQNKLISNMAKLANEEAIKIENKLNKLKVKLNDQDMSEIDFTIKGKTGGCNSCSLGDAFRCDGCPYLGLPAFKPGEVISLDNFGEDI